MKMNAKKILLQLLLALAGMAFAQAFDVRLEPDPRLDQSVFQTPEIPATSFIRSCLLASGADSDAIDRHAERLENLWQELSPDFDGTESVEEKADKILMFIYEKLLSKYDFYQTRVDWAMEKGIYNCVSSAAIFMFFCKKAGIPVVAYECVRHAYCAIYQDGSPIDVETTNPFGVNPGKKKGTVAKNGKTQYLTVPAKDYAGRHQVDDRRVVAMIYCNRIAQLQKKKLEDQTVGLAVDAYQVQNHSPISRNELDICVGNASNILTKAEREEDAIAFLKKAEEIFGPSQNWTKRMSTNYYNMILGKIKSASYLEGLACLEENKDWLSKKDCDELKEYAYATGAQAAANKHDWRAAIAIADQGLKELPQNRRLQNNKNAYTQNIAIDYHNAAADLFNSGDKEAAIQKVKQGLEEIPGSKILLSDLEKMSRAQ